MNHDEAEEYTASLGQIGGGMWRQVHWAAQQGVPAAMNMTLRQWVDECLGGYVRLAVEERRRVVAELSDEGLSQRQVADVVGISQSTVSDDRNRSLEEGDTAPDQDLLDSDDRKRSLEIQELARHDRPASVNTPPLPGRRYACIVVDPPWPMRKSERTAHPWQGRTLDYPTMTVDRIATESPVCDLADDGCHLYLWVTHRFLPAGLRLVEKWGFRYHCLMTWRKPSGFTPFSWMFDTEHVIFATRGSLKVARRGLRVSFDEPVSGHSTKPEVFYDRVRLASPGPRIDLYARSTHSGFDAWGAEI
jgi:N6-adenosine-specific RNA methylase IME4